MSDPPTLLYATETYPASFRGQGWSRGQRFPGLQQLLRVDHEERDPDGAQHCEEVSGRSELNGLRN